MASNVRKVILRAFRKKKKKSSSDETKNSNSLPTEIVRPQSECSKSQENTNQRCKTTWYVPFSTDDHSQQDGNNLRHNETTDAPSTPQNESNGAYTSTSPGPSPVLNASYWSISKITIQEFYDHFHWLTQRQIQDALRNNLQLNEIRPETSSEYVALQKCAGLSKAELALNKWFVYVQIQCASNTEQSPVVHLLPHLFAQLTNNFSNADNITVFWKSVEQLVSSLTKAWTAQCENCEEGYFSEDADILRFLGQISEYFAGRRVFSDEAERKAQVLLEFNLRKMQTVISKRAKEIFFSKIGIPTLDNLVKGIEMLMAELKNNQEYLKNIFRSYGLAPYLNAYDTMYSTWDHELAKCLKSLQKRVLSNLQPIQFINENPDLSQNFDFKEMESLFELYAVLRDFSMLNELPPLPDYGLVKGSLHSGFRPFVTQWIDMVCLKTVGWIDRAIQIDSFEPAAPSCKISSSAVDAADVFVAIKALWLELKWPDPEEAFPYAILMQEIFSRCVQHYVERIYRRVQEFESLDLENAYPSEQFCLASNNVEYILQEFQSVPTKLCIEEIIDELSISRTPDSTALEQCIFTPYNLIENLTEKINRKMAEGWEVSCAKVMPKFQTLLRDIAYGQQTDRDVEEYAEQIHDLYDKTFTQMYRNLTDTEFKKAHQILRTGIFQSLQTLVMDHLTGRPTEREQKFYDNLSVAFDKFFNKETCTKYRIPSFEIGNPEIEELQKIIKFRATQTYEHIFQYCQESVKNQRLLGEDASVGKISLLTDYNDTSEILRIKILNGSPTNWKLGDPSLYVKFQVRPRIWDTTYTKYCTEKKQVPLFEQEFELKVPKWEFKSGAYIHLWMKQGRFPFVQFVGEAFLPVKDILSTVHGVTNINSVPQTEVQLFKTAKSEILDVLERRKTDYFAQEFSKTQKSRIN